MVMLLFNFSQFSKVLTGFDLLFFFYRLLFSQILTERTLHPIPVYRFSFHQSEKNPCFHCICTVVSILSLFI